MTRHTAPGLHRITDPACRVLYWLGYRLARRWWRLRRPNHEGALVAAWISHELLLVVRQSYRREWSLPGGGVHKREEPKVAAARELAEELALEVSPEHLEPVHHVTGAWDYRRERVHVFELHLPHAPDLWPDGREIVEARLVDRATLAGIKLTPPAASYAASLAAGAEKEKNN